MDPRTQELLKKRPYLSKWFKENEVAETQNQLVHKQTESFDTKLVERLTSLTSSKIAVGRAGTRYKTNHALTMREGHAVAKDAVYSEVSPEFIKTLNAVELVSQNCDREDYLLYPNKGRRLTSESLQKLQSEGTSNVDIQIIVGDGLSSWAIERNITELLPALISELKSHGFTLGKIIFVKFARVGVQDQIGVNLNAKATVILLGERPGLGTGDSLSAYIAYNPKMDQDNSEKNCVSNIRGLGILPAEAAKLIASILKESQAKGRGGIP